MKQPPPLIEPSRFITRDGVTIAFRRHGSGSPLYVCHGGPSTTYSYLASELAPLVARHEVVFHDYRGGGQSGNAALGSYTFERMAEDLDELRRHLGHQRIALLAHSMGGFVALTYAVRFPHHCCKLVLIAASPTGRPAKMALPTLRELELRRLLRMMGRAIWYGVWWSWRRRSLARTRARYAPMDILQEGRLEFRSVVRARTERFLVENDNAPHLEREGFRIDLTAELRAITMPTLVIVGARDASFVAGAKLLRTGLPNATVSMLPDVGHNVLIEAHAEVLEMIGSFLNREGVQGAST